MKYEGQLYFIHCNHCFVWFLKVARTPWQCPFRNSGWNTKSWSGCLAVRKSQHDWQTSARFDACSRSIAINQARQQVAKL